MIVSCLRDYISFRVDAFFLELGITGGAGEQVQALVDALLFDQHSRFGHVPLVMFMLFGSVADEMPLGSVRPNQTTSHELQELRLDQKMRRQGDSIKALAAWWGWPIFSTETFRALPMRTRLAAWEADLKHPLALPKPAGRLLIATPIFDTFRAGMHACDATGGSNRWLSPTGIPSNQTHPPAVWRCLRLGATTPDMPPATASGAMSILRAADWKQVLYENASRTRLKPGMRSDIAGAQLEVGVKLAMMPPTFQFRVEYLRSYEGYGVARLGCIGRCSCPTTNVSAVNSPRDRTTVSAVFDVPIATLSEQAGGGTESMQTLERSPCILFTVLQPAFKLISVAIST